MISVIPLLLLLACSGEMSENKGSKDVISVDIVSTLHCAEHFSISYGDGFKKVEVYRPWMGATEQDTLKYYLVGRDDEVPSVLLNQRIIRIPIRQVTCFPLYLS